MNKEEIQQKVNEILKSIFDQVGVNIEINFPEDRNTQENRVYVEIDSEEDKNILIGYHGETLNSIQHLLSVMLFQAFNEQVGVIVDVGDYRKERELKLIALAESASDKSKFIKKSVALYPMNSYERKIIHDRVTEIEGVTSSSDGEGYNRHIVITPDEIE